MYNFASDYMFSTFSNMTLVEQNFFPLHFILKLNCCSTFDTILMAQELKEATACIQINNTVFKI